MVVRRTRGIFGEAREKVANYPLIGLRSSEYRMDPLTLYSHRQVRNLPSFMHHESQEKVEVVNTSAYRHLASAISRLILSYIQR